MNSKIEKFILSQGEILKDKSYFENDYVNMALKYYANAYKHPSFLRKPHEKPVIEIVKNYSFNACATVIDKVPVFVFSGAINLILSDIFRRVLARPDFFKEIGEYDLETLNEHTLQNYCFDTETLSISTIQNKHINAKCINGYNYLYPVCKLRNSFALFLTNLAWMFIYEHETTHYLNGHVEFLKDKNNIFYIDEKETYFNTSHKDYILWQTLEMDADCIAINRRINSLHSIFEAIEDDKSLLKKYPFYFDIYQMIYYQLFAINTAFIIFFLQDLYFQASHNEPEQFTHPPPNLRMQYISGVIIPHAKKYFQNLDTEKITQISEKAFEDAISAYHKTTVNSAFKEHKNILTLSKFYPEHFAKLNARWKEIRDELQKFSYKKLAPADT